MRFAPFRLKISTRIMLGFAFILTVALLGGFIAVQRLGRTIAIAERNNGKLMQEQRIALEILSETLRMNSLADQFVLSRNEADLRHFQAEGTVLRQLVQFEDTGVSAPVRELLLEELRYSVNRYCAVFSSGSPVLGIGTSGTQGAFLLHLEQLGNDILKTAGEMADTIRYDFYTSGIATQKLVRETFYQLTALFGILVLACIALAARISSAITTPISKVARAALAIADGRLGEPLDVRSYDELAELISAFNSMSTQLRASMETMEKRVEERTAELGAKVAELKEAWKTSDSLREIGQLIASTLDLDEVLERILASLENVLTYDTASMMLLHGSDIEIRTVRGFKEPARLIGLTCALSDLPLNSEIAKTAKPLIIPDTAQEPRWKALPETDVIRSWLGVPLFAGDEVAGILAVDSHEQNHFSTDHIPLVRAFASQASVALQNARLYEQTSYRAQQLAALNELSRVISGELNKYKIMRGLCDELRTVMKLDTFHGSVYDAKTDILTFLIWYESGTYHSFDSGPLDRYKWSSKVIRSREPSIVLRTKEEVEEEQDRRKQEQYDIRPSASMLFAPVTYGDSVLGIISVQSYEYNAYTKEDLELLANTARQAAIALRNADLFEEMQNALRTANEANKLKSQFLANMSHELRTPLNSIINFAYLLNLGTEGPVTPGQYDMIHRMENSGRHLLGLINDVLDLAKIESGKFEMNFGLAQIGDIILDAVAVSSGLVKNKPVDLRAVLPSQLPMVFADKMRVRQVLLNLISNAAKFTDQGKITVRAETARDFSSVRVIVEDTGIGIAKEDIPKVFLEFVQLDGELTRKTGGTGLGLPISRHFIEMHGGVLQVDSEPGKGSRFSFTLRCFDGPLPQAT